MKQLTGREDEKMDSLIHILLPCKSTIFHRIEIKPIAFWRNMNYGERIIETC